MYSVALDPIFDRNIEMHLRYGNKKLVQKVFLLLDELSLHPRTGTAKPEQLKGFGEREVWSRRIDSKHRLIYEIKDQELIVVAISAYGHYEDR